MAAPNQAKLPEPEQKVYSTHKVNKAEFIVDAVLVGICSFLCMTLFDRARS